MKKLLALGVFILFGSMVFAQTPSKAKAAPAPATNHVATATPVAAEAAVSDDAVAKKESKKECSDAEKKQCGTKSGKKSCCSSKTEATKEETK